jgi:hypothetical protein
MYSVVHAVLFTVCLVTLVTVYVCVLFVHEDINHKCMKELYKKNWVSDGRISHVDVSPVAGIFPKDIPILPPPTPPHPTPPPSFVWFNNISESTYYWPPNIRPSSDMPALIWHGLALARHCQCQTLLIGITRHCPVLLGHSGTSKCCTNTYFNWKGSLFSYAINITIICTKRLDILRPS